MPNWDSVWSVVAWKPREGEEEQDLDRMFSKGGLNVGAVVGANTNGEDRCLGVSKIKLYGAKLHALLESELRNFIVFCFWNQCRLIN